MKNHKEVLIVGAGLSGLTLAYLLSRHNISVTIVEASGRIGGRINTLKGKRETPLELGATWFSDMHLNLISLLQELGLHKYSQFTSGKSLFQTSSFTPVQEFEVSPAEPPSYRIAGGTQTLTDALYSALQPDDILYNTPVVSIQETQEGLRVTTANHNEYTSDRVVLCLPPQLIASEIQFTPQLPDPVHAVLKTAQTWMAGSIKFVLEYDHPFWRQDGYSGMLFSHCGIITEMYDHTHFEGDKYGFTGFLKNDSAIYSQEVRKEKVLKQLELLLGKAALHPLSYQDKVWTDAFINNNNPIIQKPHQNNGHPIFERSYLNKKLFFAGTESSPRYSGYMEGAIISAKTAFQKLIN